MSLAISIALGIILVPVIITLFILAVFAILYAGLGIFVVLGKLHDKYGWWVTIFGILTIIALLFYGIDSAVGIAGTGIFIWGYNKFWNWLLKPKS